ncbi:unnamed protein product [Cylicocyclus nassatus]|uniref:Uncharacterized protein n=1 Tax=Cylicocyclus nassatus TaxID=53992 RepID=A0AA36M1U7_CYLNA|nr:unnamed protein product [Cylicocyclus nassatus]
MRIASAVTSSCFNKNSLVKQTNSTMFDFLVQAYFLTVIGLTAGQLNFGTTSLPLCQNDAACTPPSVCIDKV